MPSYVLTPSAMREADRTAIEEHRIPALTLMENAGQALADWVGRLIPKGRFLILCGKGNNGGDGLVIARYLAQRGREVVVFLANGVNLSVGANKNFKALQDLAKSNHGLRIVSDKEIEDVLVDSIVIDALLGTGISRDLDVTLQRLIERVNQSTCKVISVDIPSGLNGKSGMPMPIAIRADYTLTLAALKTGLVLNRGPEFAGELSVFDIGIEETLLRDLAGHVGCGEWVSQEDAMSFIPEKKPGRHKYSEGDLIAVTGSSRYPGAAILSARAAMRVGCGFVNLFVPTSIAKSLNASLLEVVVHGLGKQEQKQVDSSFVTDIETVRKEKSTALLGCGLGRTDDTHDLVCKLLRTFDRGVLDADGISGFEGRLNQLRELEISDWILTPHAGELSRLVSETEYADIESSIEQVAELSKYLETHILLKGTPVVLASPTGAVKFFQGSPEFATAGTGDVLAGMIAGFVAQGLAIEKAALAALATGMAGLWAFKSKYPSLSLIASDLLLEE